MRKPRWTAIAVAILAATLALITLFRAKEPTYKGRALSNWVISGYQNPGPEAETAIGEIGTNGIPFLLEWIQYEPAPWRAKLAATVVRIAPSAANSRLTGAITARNRLTREPSNYCAGAAPSGCKPSRGVPLASSQ